MAKIVIKVKQSDLEFFDKMGDRLRPLLDDIEKEIATKSLRLVKGNTPVGLVYKPLPVLKSGGKGKRKGNAKYQKSGELKRSWKVGKHTEGHAIETNRPYARVLEEGLYPGTTPQRLIYQPAVGKGGVYGIRTVRTGEGIFSTQAREGIIAPLLKEDAKAFQSIINDVVNQTIREMYRGVQD